MSWDTNSQELTAICESLPSDEEWDMNEPMEAAFKAAGLKRFAINRLMLKKDSHQEEFKCKTESTMHREDKASFSQLLGGSSSSSSGDSVVVKIENPKHLELANEIKVLRAGESRVAALVGQLKKLNSTTLARDHADSLIPSPPKS
jgi:hypothetical protein